MRWRAPSNWYTHSTIHNCKCAQNETHFLFPPRTQNANNIRSFELVVHNAKSAAALTVGRYETRCIALLWLLATCVANKCQRGIVLLHEMIEVHLHLIGAFI